MFPSANDQLIETLAKETVPTLRFGPDDVLAYHQPDYQRRRRDADRAVLLGNAHHGKVTILFQTADGQTKRVQTTVWAADSSHLTLKAGATLPLRAVLGIDFY